MTCPRLFAACFVLAMSCAPARAQLPLFTARAGIGAAHRFNPAARPHYRAAVAVGRPYGIPELTVEQVSAAGNHAFARLEHTGFDDFLEVRTALGGRAHGLAVEVAFTSMRVPGFRAHSSGSLTLGITRNRLGAVISRQALRLGLHHRIPPWDLSADVYAVDGVPGAGAAAEYVLTPVLLIGAVSLNPDRIGLGVLLHAGPVRIGLGFNRHPELGWSSAMGVSWR